MLRDGDAMYFATQIRENCYGASAVSRAVQEVIDQRAANRGGVMVALSHILAQCIVAGGPESAETMRAAIIALIDGYAMRHATGEL